LLDVPVPCADVVERSFVCNVVYEQDAHCPTVISSCDRSETFLTRSIPDLQLDTFSIKFDCPYLEVDADGGDERWCPCVVAETEQETRLADARVAYEEELDEEIVMGRRHIGDAVWEDMRCAECAETDELATYEIPNQPKTQLSSRERYMYVLTAFSDDDQGRR